MEYQKIKRTLRQVESLATGGDVASAYALIRGMVGKGLSAHDMHTNLSRKALRKLRAFEVKGGKA
jgi:hypothetical protein